MTEKEMSEIEIEEKIILFKKNNTYVYLKIFSGNKLFNYNGHIQSNKEDSILFKDDFLGEIPIMKKDISKIDFSFKKKEKENE